MMTRFFDTDDYAGSASSPRLERERKRSLGGLGVTVLLVLAADSLC